VSAPYMTLYVADYLGDTRHLTTEQHGAYLLLLMTMWRSGGVLSDDPSKLARISGLTVARWKRISDDVMAFFTPCEGGLTQARLAAELTISDEKSEKNAQAGRMGGRAKALKDKKAHLANAMRPPCPPEPEPVKIYEPTVHCPAKPNVVALNEDFNRAWKAYPAQGRQRSKSQAKTLPIWREAAKAAGGAERLANAVARYVREDATHKGECGPPAFDRWLRDGRWEHWLPDSNAPNGGGSAMSPELIAARRALLQQAPESPNA